MNLDAPSFLIGGVAGMLATAFIFYYVLRGRK